MRMRLGFALGLAAGFVAGTAAGRERFEQMKTALSGLGETKQGREVRETVSRLTGEAKTRLEGGRSIDLDLPISELSR